MTLGLTRAHKRPQDVSPPGVLGLRKDLSSSWAVTPNLAYDMALEAALRSLGCGPRKLDITGPWRWLLLSFSEAYGVPQAYTALTYLLWAMKPQHATPTADCFEMLLREMAPMRVAADEGKLQPQELEIFRFLCNAVDGLVGRCFESYKQLLEQAPSGIAPDGYPVTEHPAPALRPAAGLFCLLRDALAPQDQRWLAERFRTASRRRYLRLEVACLDGKGPGGGGSAPVAEDKENRIPARGERRWPSRRRRLLLLLLLTGSRRPNQRVPFCSCAADRRLLAAAIANNGRGGRKGGKKVADPDEESAVHLVGEPTLGTEMHVRLP